MNKRLSPTATAVSCRTAILATLLAGVCLPAAAQTLDQRKAAARATITNHSGTGQACSINFYWEIGDQHGKLDGDTKGLFGPNANTEMQIYSAGKWFYGAYVFQLRGGQLNDEDKDSLRMQSGYNQGNACLLSNTVGACQNLMNGYTQSADDDDRFYYAGGHFQKHAVDLGHGSKTRPQMVTEMRSKLDTPDGPDTNVVFTLNTPVLASGYRTTANNYAVFLRKMLSGTLLLSGSALGSDAVCTYPGPDDAPTGRVNCDGAIYSPLATPPPGVNEIDTGANEMASYSIGHWVEDDPVNGDGAYSSPGAAGFYPWIDASRNWYGIVARNFLTNTASAESVYCGRLIRKAWVTGIAQ